MKKKSVLTMASYTCNRHHGWRTQVVWAKIGNLVKGPFIYHIPTFQFFKIKINTKIFATPRHYLRYIGKKRPSKKIKYFSNILVSTQKAFRKPNKSIYLM